eukprot:Lankesteria_metandrocarpae@DN4027_c0_g1_i1.p1
MLSDALRRRRLPSVGKRLHETIADDGSAQSLFDPSPVLIMQRSINNTVSWPMTIDGGTGGGAVGSTSAISRSGEVFQQQQRGSRSTIGCYCRCIEVAGVVVEVSPQVNLEYNILHCRTTDPTTTVPTTATSVPTTTASVPTTATVPTTGDVLISGEVVELGTDDADGRSRPLGQHSVGVSYDEHLSSPVEHLELFANEPHTVHRVRAVLVAAALHQLEIEILVALAMLSLDNRTEIRGCALRSLTNVVLAKTGLDPIPAATITHTVVVPHPGTVLVQGVCGERVNNKSSTETDPDAATTAKSTSDTAAAIVHGVGGSWDVAGRPQSPLLSSPMYSALI